MTAQYVLCSGQEHSRKQPRACPVAISHEPVVLDGCGIALQGGACKHLRVKGAWRHMEAADLIVQAAVPPVRRQALHDLRATNSAQ